MERSASTQKASRVRPPLLPVAMAQLLPPEHLQSMDGFARASHLRPTACCYGRPGCALCFVTAQPKSHSQRVLEPRLRGGLGATDVSADAENPPRVGVYNFLKCPFKRCFTLFIIKVKHGFT